MGQVSCDSLNGEEAGCNLDPRRDGSADRRSGIRFRSGARAGFFDSFELSAMATWGIAEVEERFAKDDYLHY